MGKIKICLTGSTVFIGGYFTKSLSRNMGIKLIPFYGNLLKIEDIINFFKKNKNIDQIIHLAGTFFGEFKELLDINVLTTSNLLK